MTLSGPSTVLVMRCGGIHCGLPITSVQEVFRPLAVEPVGDAPAFVRGLARVRGAAVPVFDLRLFLGLLVISEAQRWVSVRVDARSVVLAVDEVLDVRDLGAEPLAQMPPLLSEALPAVQALASLDSQLFVLLQAARLLPALDGLSAHEPGA